MKVLLSDTDTDILESLSHGLSQYNFVVDTISTSKQLYWKPFFTSYDVCLIDIDFFIEDALFEFAVKLRDKFINIPLFFLLPENDIRIKKKLFDLGIDDCIVKPFAHTELTARINRFIRIYSNITSPQISNIYNFDDLVVNLSEREVVKAGKQVFLRKKEFQLLQFLIQNPYKLLTREHILSRVWFNSPEVTTTTVDVHMSSLKKRLKLGSLKKLIHTIYGEGYEFGVRG